MNPTTKKKAIRHAFFRLGLHTKPKGVVHALAQQGIAVDEEFVREVRIELLKETTDHKPAKASRPFRSPAVRRRPQRFPGRNQS
jgi:hypothetical protein